MGNPTAKRKYAMGRTLGPSDWLWLSNDGKTLWRLATYEDERLIRNTDQPIRYPWPDDFFLQGGSCGLVLAGAESYTTAFVEGSPKGPPTPSQPGTFLRGKGETIADAEDALWAKYQTMANCPGHGPYERRNYRNGAGYCVNCGTWFSKVFDPLPVDPAGEPSELEALFRATGMLDDLCTTCDGQGAVCCGRVLDTGECCATLNGGSEVVPCPDCGGSR